MIVGLLTIDLHIPEANSLKSKRMVIKSLIEKIRNRYNVSVAEVDANDLWQRSVIGIALVANETAYIHSVLEKIRQHIIATHSVELINSTTEML